MTGRIGVGILALHTSPLRTAGSGDAGGMNVYVRCTAVALARIGLDVEVFTADVDVDSPDTEMLGDGVRVHALRPSAPLTDKEHLANDVETFVAEMLAHPSAASLDVLHSHYWLSGLVAEPVARALGIPFVHTMHTMARVKERDLLTRIDSDMRVEAEDDLVRYATLVVSTRGEAEDAVELYGADPAHVRVISPGVELDVFSPGDRDAARAAVGLPDDLDLLVLNIGRVQRVKGSDIALGAFRGLREADPELAARTRLAIIGGRSGAAPSPDGDVAAWPAGASTGPGIEPTPAEIEPGGRILDVEAQDQERLALWMRAADLVIVPSRSESFGLVAAESLACGIPVLAARVGGLVEVVEDGVTGILVRGHDAGQWTEVLREVLTDDRTRERMQRRAISQRERFDWRRTAAELRDLYSELVGASRDATRHKNGRTNGEKNV